jgi:hypothetical protein
MTCFTSVYCPVASYPILLGFHQYCFCFKSHELFSSPKLKKTIRNNLWMGNNVLPYNHTHHSMVEFDQIVKNSIHLNKGILNWNKVLKLSSFWYITCNSCNFFSITMCTLVRRVWFFKVLTHWNESTCSTRHVTPLWHIILIPSQPVFVLSP